MKMITLLTAAYVGGVLRHPHEGAIPVSDTDAGRMVKDKVAEDVTDDFTDEQLAEVTPEAIAIASGAEAARPASNPHLSEVPPAEQAKPETDNKLTRKGGHSKE